MTKKQKTIISYLSWLLSITAILIASCFIFNKNYYTQIYVSGSSMKPTLNNYTDGYVDYGRADTSSGAINGLKRFDVIVTTYPNEWKTTDNSWKIKRLWGLPGDTITLKNGYFKVIDKYQQIVELNPKIEDHFYTYSTTQKKFRVDFSIDRQFLNFTLQENQYFVMGDNWASSYDSYSENIENHNEKKLIYKDLKGLVVSLDGKGKVENDRLISTIPYRSRYFF